CALLIEELEIAAGGAGHRARVAEADAGAALARRVAFEDGERALVADAGAFVLNVDGDLARGNRDDDAELAAFWRKRKRVECEVRDDLREIFAERDAASARIAASRDLDLDAIRLEAERFDDLV